MIVLDLVCPQDHLFEGWFASTSAFDDQLHRQLVSCPVCGSSEVRRMPSAPYVQTRMSESTASAVAARAPNPDAAAALVASLRLMARAAEDVGERFPEEARNIHRGDSEARSIRGAASRDELGELLAEGIMVLPVPPEEDLH